MRIRKMLTMSAMSCALMAYGGSSTLVTVAQAQQNASEVSLDSLKQGANGLAAEIAELQGRSFGIEADKAKLAELRHVVSGLLENIAAVSSPGDPGELNFLADELAGLKTQLVALADIALTRPPAPDPLDIAADQRARQLVSGLTLAQKAAFFQSNGNSNGGAGTISGIPGLGIPAIREVDSSTGSSSSDFTSTFFPATIALAASWDGQLAYDYGLEIAKQLRAQGYGMGLGGGANMVRDPRGGRIYEYLGEDPVLAGVLLSQRTLGTQSQKVMATLKHPVGNEQEFWRGSDSLKAGVSRIDERTLREFYLLPFEMAVKTASPGNIMCSYNQLAIGDGPASFTCEHKYLLTDIIKNDWGYKGQIQSDWWATHDGVKAINAGLDEEGGSRDKLTASAISAALSARKITQARVDDMVFRKLRSMIRVGLMDWTSPAPTIDFAAGRSLAQKVAEESSVLLKNAENILPLNAARLTKIAVVGGHADDAVLAGSGSGNTKRSIDGSYGTCGSLVTGLQTRGCIAGDSAIWKILSKPILQAIKDAAPDVTVTYSGNSDRREPFRPYTESEINEAVARAGESDVAIVVVYQTAGEADDLKSLSLTNSSTSAGVSNQDELVARVATANPNTIVIVESGNPILMPWLDKVASVLQVWYPGEGAGPAIANLLFGRVNPSGKLPITFPVSDAQTPTGGATFAENPVYTEKLLVGYRWYEAKNETPLFSFGFGLSYTTFAYSNVSVTDTFPTGTKRVKFTLTNTGSVAGKEVAQVYMRFPEQFGEPKRLVGWQKVDLAPGASRDVTIDISLERQRYWDITSKKWKILPDGQVLVGASSRDIRYSSEPVAQ